MVRVFCEKSNKEFWNFSTIEDLKRILKDKTKDEIVEVVDAVDILTLGCRTNPTRVKDIDDNVTFSGVGCYKGARKIT